MTQCLLSLKKIDDSRAGLEKTGAAFTTEKMLAVRGITRAAIHEIAGRCKPGMVEEDAVEMAKEILASHGMVQGWHDVYVRFGTNTTKTFGAPSDPGIILGTDDVFLIDIGPVFEKWEGDGGDTFITGTNPAYARLRRGRQNPVSSGAKENGKTRARRGVALYDFATAEAAKMGWEAQSRSFGPSHLRFSSCRHL